MKLKIGGSEYSVNPSFLTMVKYRAEYGKSILQEKIAEQEVLIKLLYVAIEGEKPYFHIFTSECLSDSSFELSALAFYKQMLLKDCPNKVEGNSTKEPNEFEILALTSIANIDIKLLDILNIFQVVLLINKYCEAKNPHKSVKKMETEERKAFYGISEQKEQEIEEILLKQMQE